MNLAEKEILEKLKELKENYHVVGIKAEFGQEGTTFEEIHRLKDFVLASELDLTVKISGCEAVKDIYEVKKSEISSIVVPMIESPYAVKKFMDSVKIVFSKAEYEKIKKYINIETIYGFNCLEDILNSSKDITGIVMGRTDMAGSLGLSKDEVNSEQILDYAKKIAQKSKLYEKEFIIGGGVSDLSVDFFKKFPKNFLNKFETRKIIFDAQSFLNDKKALNGISKALEFELLWLKYRQNISNSFSSEDEKRVKILETRCKALNI